MTVLNVELPNEILEDVIEVSKQLNQTPEELMQMALSLLMQSDSLDNAIEAKERMNDGQTPVALPALDKEDLELSIQLHPDALVEFSMLDEEDQLDVLSDLIERVVSEEGEEPAFDNTLDLVINETEDSQVILSSFEYGDIVYKVSDSITIYLLNLPDLVDDEFEDAEEDEDEQTAKELN